jgi:hypothetical protein
MKCSLPIYLLCAALPLASRAADVTKADNGLPLNDPASWSAGIFPGAADRAVFPAPSADTAAELGAAAAWNGLLADPADFAWTLNGRAALTLGSGGITANRTPERLGDQFFHAPVGYRRTASGPTLFSCFSGVDSFYPPA